VAVTAVDLPLELLAGVCHELDLPDLVCFAGTCKRFRHGDGGVETVELPTKSPVVAALSSPAFPGEDLIPSSRDIGCSKLWVAYLVRCARQRRFREAPPIAAGQEHSLFVSATGRLLTCGKGAAAGHGYVCRIQSEPAPVAALTALRVRSVAAGSWHSLALGCDGSVYSWGHNACRQLGHGDNCDRTLPMLVKGLAGICSVAAADCHSVAATTSGPSSAGAMFLDDFVSPAQVPSRGSRE
jgi:hypothetical protein